MQKKVFIIHGWDGYPEEGWFPWLKQELENKGFDVAVPEMPETSTPKIDMWVKHLTQIVGEPDVNTFFVGHSIGCQTIMRYLETLSPEKKIGGAVLVAGWFTLMNLETAEEKEIAKPWLSKKINFSKIKQHSDKFFAIFSDNDPVVPVENKELFEKNLSAKIITEKSKGHFSGSDGVIELPSVLDALLQMTK